MDLNYLFHRQQVERFRAERATSNEASTAHARLAALYENSIERMTEGRIRIARSEHLECTADLPGVRRITAAAT
jgi:SOS-response transcriptional repressor LexA